MRTALALAILACSLAGCTDSGKAREEEPSREPAPQPVTPKALLGQWKMSGLVLEFRDDGTATVRETQKFVEIDEVTKKEKPGVHTSEFQLAWKLSDGVKLEIQYKKERKAWEHASFLTSGRYDLKMADDQMIMTSEDGAWTLPWTRLR
jgi:hypothetical protein